MRSTKQGLNMYIWTNQKGWIKSIRYHTVIFLAEEIVLDQAINRRISRMGGGLVWTWRNRCPGIDAKKPWNSKTELAIRDQTQMLDLWVIKDPTPQVWLMRCCNQRFNLHHSEPPRVNPRGPKSSKSRRLGVWRLMLTAWKLFHPVDGSSCPLWVQGVWGQKTELVANQEGQRAGACMFCATPSLLRMG